MGEKIRGLRKRLGLSQEELAEKLGVSRQAVSKWETGSDIPAAAKLKEIADFFGVTVDSMLSDGGTPEPKPINPDEPDKMEKPKLTRQKAAAVFFLAAAVLILVFLLCLILSGNAKSAAASSVIRLDGIGLSVIPAIILLAVGVILFFRKE